MKNPYRLKGMYLVALSLGMAASTSTASAQLRGKTYDLPLYANDLKGGEYYKTKDHLETSTQKFGYDITANHHTGSKWTSLDKGITTDEHWDDPKNSNYLIYGKKFYAMAAGTVIGCWRRGPNNLRPKLPEESNSGSKTNKMWYHPFLRDGFLPGGGNELWILHDDGTRALYAHALKDSIPSSLCPKPLEKFATKKSNSDPIDENGMYSHIAVPENQRKRVKAGQFLGRVGHSGISTGPHIHIHLEKQDSQGKWIAAPLRWKRGMATTRDEAVKVSDWKSFSKKSLPKGTIIFWPPTKLSKEYAKHGATSTNLGGEFKHLSNSGFRPKSINGYNVGGKVYYNHIWEPSKGGWRAYYGQTQSSYQSNLDKAKADGYAPVYVDSYVKNGQPRYTVIYAKNKSGKWMMRSNRSKDAYKTAVAEAKAQSLRPVSVSVVSLNGKRRYTTLFRSESLGSWKNKSAVIESDYQALVVSEKAAGRLPIYLDGYKHDGKTYFSAIFSSKYASKTRAKHYMSGSDYQKAWKKAMKDGYVTKSVTAFDMASNKHRFAAVWIKQ